MNTFLYQVIVLASSLMLALPSGSCTAFVRHDGTDSASVKKASCCPQTDHNRPCDSGQFPSKPSFKCCCERDAALPEKSVQPTDSVKLGFAILADHVPMNVGSVLGIGAAVIPSHSGHHLQILLCVWRC